MSEFNVPTVSIIAPVYNMSRYLPEFIISVRSQTYKNFELILIDDGSTDDSYDLCKSYAAQDARIIAFHQENTGVSCARNKGLELSRGKWISFVDPDDYIESNFLETILSDVEKDSDIQLVQCYTKRFDDNGKIYTYKKFYSENLLMTGKDWLYNAVFYFTRNVILPRTVLYRASTIKDNNIQFDSQYFVCEDCDFVFHYAKHIKKAYINIAELYCYRQHTESLTHVKGISKAQFSAMQFYRDYIAQNAVDKGIESGFLFAKLKIYARLLVQELLLELKEVDDKESLGKRVDSVKKCFISLYGNEAFTSFSDKPLYWLKDMAGKVYKTIDWNTKIPFKMHLLLFVIIKTPIPFLKNLLRIYKKVR